MKKMTIIAAAVLASATASAEFNYNFVEGSFASFENGSDDDKGYVVSGSHELVDGIVVSASLTEVDDNATEARILEVGAAKVIPIHSNLDLTAGVSFYDESVKNAGGEDGMKINLGARYNVAPKTELSALVSNVRPSNSAYDTSIEVKFGASYAVTESLEVGASYTVSDEEDADSYALTARFNF